MENWKDIPEFNGRYQVSDLGRVKSIRPKYKDKILRPAIGTCKYQSVSLMKKSFMVHRLVAIAFHNNPNNLPQVNHKDGIKTNNNADNLEWCTRQENMDHGLAKGLMRKHKGQTHHFAKLTPNDVINIKFNRFNSNIPYQVIAEFFGVSKQAVMDIVKGKNWAHL